MMQRKLLKALEPIEEEFDVVLITDTEALEFVKLDMESVINILNKEINFHKENEDFVNGIAYSIGVISAFYQNRIDEGY